MADEETNVWTGSPSQIVNALTFTGCAVAAVAIIVLAVMWDLRCLWLLLLPAGWGCYKRLVVKCTRIELSTQRLRVTRGILAKRTDELELYRVKDTSLYVPLAMRLVGAGNIVLDTSDKSTPQVTLRAVPHADQLREAIRNGVEALRTAKGIRELDID